MSSHRQQDRASIAFRLKVLSVIGVALLILCGIADDVEAQPLIGPPPFDINAAIAANRLRIQTISRNAPSDAEALFRLFDDPEIVDDGTVNGRLEAILLATCQVRLTVLKTGAVTLVTAMVQIGGVEIPVTLQVPQEIDLGNPNDLRLGVPIHRGVVFRDRGLRKNFQDGSNQIGHFLIAVRLGYDRAFIVNPFVQSLLLGTRSADDAVRIIIGHEQEALGGGDQAGQMDRVNPLNPFERYAREIHSPTDAEVEAFKRNDLTGIRVGSGPGQSRKDLMLSYVGWTMGQLFQNGHFKTREEVVKWLRIALM